MVGTRFGFGFDFDFDFDFEFGALFFVSVFYVFLKEGIFPALLTSLEPPPTERKRVIRVIRDETERQRVRL